MDSGATEMEQARSSNEMSQSAAGVNNLASSATSNRHSQELAQQLVRHLGIKGATRTCIENHWQGVLAIVQSMGPKS